MTLNVAASVHQRLLNRAHAMGRPFNELLQYFTRTELVWPGKYDDEGNLVPPRRVSLPFQVIERVNETRITPHPGCSAGGAVCRWSRL